MARKPRVHFEGALYHVIVRGNNREFIFKDDHWKQNYLEIIKRYKEKFGFKLYGYVIMDNHAHLIIEVTHIPLSKVMQSIQQVFTQKYNRKLRRTGHVFEQRYKAILCDKDQYLLGLIRYVHQNPLRANIVVGLDYKWSSYKEYIDETSRYITDIEFPFGLFDNRLDRFVTFMTEEDTEFKKVTVREFSEDIDEYEEISRTQTKEVKLDLESIVELVCEEMNLDKSKINEPTRLRKVANARQLIAYIASYNPRITQVEVANQFDLKQNSISMMLSKEDVGEKFRIEIEKLVI